MTSGVNLRQVGQDKYKIKLNLNQCQRCQVEMSVMREISRLQYVKSGRNIPAKHKVACPSLGLFGYISGRSPAKSGDLAPLLTELMKCPVIENCTYVAGYCSHPVTTLNLIMQKFSCTAFLCKHLANTRIGNS